MFHRPRLFTNKQRPAFHYAPATLENRWYNIVRGRNLMSYSEDLGAEVSDEATSNPSADTPKAAKPSRLFTTIKVLVLSSWDIGRGIYTPARKFEFRKVDVLARMP